MFDEPQLHLGEIGFFFLRCGMFYSKAKMKFLTDTHTPKMLYCSEFHLGKVFGGAFAHIVEISYHTVVL